MYYSAEEFWQRYRGDILRLHPDERYVAITNEKGLERRTTYYRTISDLTRDFPTFVDVESWNGSPMIVDLHKERERGSCLVEAT